MTASLTQPPEPRRIPEVRKSRAPLYAVIALLVVGAAGAGAWALWGADSSTDRIAAGDIHVVERGRLSVSIRQGGTIHHRDKVIVKSKLEGNSTVIWIIDEGKQVEKGALLLELDASKFEQKKEQQDIVVINSEANLISAREALAVTKNDAQTAIDDAKLAIKLAELDHKKYVEGEFPQQVEEAQADITIAREELQRARDRVEWSTTLEKDGYLTRTELQADELAAKRSELKLSTAQSKLKVLKQYTYVRKLAELENNLAKVRRALDPVERKAAADIRQAEAKLKARESEHKQQLLVLKKATAQIKECKVYAPVSGEVVYATTTSRHHWRSSPEPLGEGSTVHERQELFHMPGEDKIMMAVTSIPQASRNKVIDPETKRLRRLPARVTIDEVKDKYFPATLAKMAPMPSKAQWYDTNKVFTTEVHVNEVDSDLRPGYSCSVEIIVAQYDKVLSVPLQAVHMVKGQPTVHVMTAYGPKPRAVEIGLDNNRMVHIKSGLKEDDEVLLSPPLGEAAVDAREPNGKSKAATTRPASKAEQPGTGPMGSMTPEQRKKMFEKLTPEQKEALLKRMREKRGGAAPGGGRPTGRPGGGAPKR